MNNGTFARVGFVPLRWICGVIGSFMWSRNLAQPHYVFDKSGPPDGGPLVSALRPEVPGGGSLSEWESIPVCNKQHSSYGDSDYDQWEVPVTGNFKYFPSNYGGISQRHVAVGRVGEPLMRIFFIVWNDRIHIFIVVLVFSVYRRLKDTKRG